MYKDFVRKNILFSKSIIFKIDIVATTINANLEYKGYSINHYDKSSWRYYLNLAGEKHVSNKEVMIKLIETGDIVELTKEVLEQYKYTKEELLKSENFYNEIISTYPTEVDYIKGCLNPCDINYAIDSSEGTILSYNKFFLETNETNIISQLENYLIKILYRWKIDKYSKHENLYVPSLLGVIYNNLPAFILNLRLKNINTPFVNSYLLKEYFKSNGLGLYIPYLNNVSKFWLYRNLEYIKHNIGKNKTLKDIIDNVFTPNSIGIARLEVKEYTGIKENTFNQSSNNRKVIITPDALNDFYDSSDTSITISEILESELVEVDPLEGLTDEYLSNFEHELNNVENTLELLKQNNETTKLLYITPKKIFDFFSNRIESLIFNWVYMLKNDIYYTVIDYNDPNNGTTNSGVKRLGNIVEYTDPNNSKTYSLNSYTGLLLLLKLLSLLEGKDDVVINSINYYNIIPDKIDINNKLFFNDGLSYNIIKELNDTIPEYPSNIANYKDFKSYMEKYYDYIKKSWIKEVNTQNTFVQTNIKRYFELTVKHGSYVISPENKSINELLIDNGIDFKINSSFETTSSIRSLIKAFTGIEDNYFFIQEQIDAFKKLLNKLTSYTTQVINNSNDIDNMIYLYNNNPTAFTSKKGLMTILKTYGDPLEKLDATLHSYMDDYKGFLTYDIYNKPAIVSDMKKIEGTFVNYKNNSIIRDIPINIISIENLNTYDILNEEFKDIFIFDLVMNVEPLENKIANIESSDIKSNDYFNLNLNNTNIRKVSSMSPLTGVSALEATEVKMENIIKPNNIISISDVDDYDIINDVDLIDQVDFLNTTNLDIIVNTK